jgi:hypothetical protein
MWLRVVSGVCHEVRQMSADRPVALVPHSSVGLFIPVIRSGPPASYAAREVGALNHQCLPRRELIGPDQKDCCHASLPLSRDGR